MKTGEIAGNVLILGGGLAGLEAAIQLRKINFAVELISERDYLYFYPNSIWVPTGERKSEDLQLDLKELARIHGFTFRQAAVERIEIEKNQILAGGEEISYEYLVIALGGGRMKHPGIEHTLSICGHPTEAVRLKERLDELLAQKQGKIAVGFGGNPNDSSAVRGGPGFEVIFNIHHLLKQCGLRKNFELTFFAPMEKPGARLGEKALSMMNTMFRKMEIQTKFGNKITSFERNGVHFADNSRLAADLIMFIPALKGHPVLENSNLPLSAAGFISINNQCQVEGYENIFAIGDAAALQGPDWRAKQAHVGEVMARAATFNIAAIQQGRPERQGYDTHLNVICVMDSGNGAAYVYRDAKGARMIPLPIVGHWLKKLFGLYYSLSRRKKFPRLPGL